MKKRRDEHSVWSEPHLHGGEVRSDPSERKADAVLARERASRREGPNDRVEDERVEHSVWNEPARSRELSGQDAPTGAATYGAWLARRREATDPRRTWRITLGVALLAGPLAIFGALWGSGATLSSVLALVVFGPLVEETMKVVGPLYLVEKRPYLFRSSSQILVCAFAGGLSFATIENLIYLNVYIPDPSDGIILWRWTVCVVLHTGCSLVAGRGLVRVWQDTWRRMERPRLELTMRHHVAATAIHGAYNAFALVLSAAEFQF